MLWFKASSALYNDDMNILPYIWSTLPELRRTEPGVCTCCSLQSSRQSCTHGTQVVHCRLMHNAALISSSQEFEVDQWYSSAPGRTDGGGGDGSSSSSSSCCCCSCCCCCNSSTSRSSTKLLQVVHGLTKLCWGHGDSAHWHNNVNIYFHEKRTMLILCCYVCIVHHMSDIRYDDNGCVYSVTNVFVRYWGILSLAKFNANFCYVLYCTE